MRVFYLIIFLITTINLVAQNNKIVIKIKPEVEKKSNSILSEIKKELNTELLNLEQFIKPFQIHKSKSTDNIENIYIININDDVNLNALVAKISKYEGVTYAEPYPVSFVTDYNNSFNQVKNINKTGSLPISNSYTEPNDPYLANQYYLVNTRTLEAHKISKGDTNIVIGIVDSGVDLLHEDLKDNYKYNYNDPINNIDDDGDGYIDNFYGWDVAFDDNNPQSEVNSHGSTNYHGTQVSGIAAATTHNELGIASIGYKTKLLPIKTMDGSGRITAGYEGIMYAATHGCSIINLSWGNNTYSQFAQDVINYVTEEYGCLIVAAAGNKNAAEDKRPDTWFYPASYDNVFSVAATGPSDERWSGSSYGITVDVSAPGQGTYTTNQFNSYKYTFGTSSAAPLVSGLAALLKAYRPNLSSKQLAQQIRITSDYIDSLPQNIYYSKQLGYGRINAEKALSINSLPSIRVDSFAITCGEENYSCETLSISFIATNYLAQATNTTIRLTSNSEFIKPIENTIQTGKLGTFSQVSNTTTPFLFEVDSELPYNEKVWFEFEMSDDGYTDYQIFETVVKKDFLEVSKNDIKTTVTSNGKIGFANWEKELGIGIHYNGENTVSNAGIIIGTDAQNMASALYNLEDFTSIKIVDTISIQDGLEANTYFKTRTETNLSLNIDYKVLLPNDNDLKNVIIHNYTINNNRESATENIKLSQFIDWDLSHPNYNTVGFVDELNMAYTYSKTSNVIYSAICLLNNMNTTPYAFELVAGGNGGIDITQGFSNDLKWFTMNNSKYEAGTDKSFNDVASMLTTDFFTINNNDSVNIAFAHIFGSNLLELKQKASKLIDDFNQPVSVFKQPVEFDVFPNPAQSKIYIDAPYEGNLSILLYNNEGKLIQKTKSIGKDPTCLDIHDLPNGVYFINIEHGKKTISEKIIINH